MRDAGPLALVALAAVALLAAREGFARTFEPGADPTPSDGIAPLPPGAESDWEGDLWEWDGIMYGEPVNIPFSLDARIAAFGEMVGQFESNGRYNVIFGGQTFDSFADHPRIRVWFYDRRKPLQPGRTVNNYSDAAGKYQFLSTTWEPIARRLQLPDFSPPSQDAAFVEKLRELRVIEALEAGDVETALKRAAGTWASLPGSTALQNPQTLQAALDSFNSYLSA